MSTPPVAPQPQPPRRKGMKPTHEQTGAYRAALAHFNESLFAGELTEVVLSFSREETTAHELNLNPDHLVDRTPREAAAALVHEMCHVWRLRNGKAPRRGYHDRPWAEKMLSVGLTPSGTGAVGGKTTGDKVGTLINGAGPFVDAYATLPDVDLLAWRSSGEERRKSVNQWKATYTCGCSTAWGKRGLSMQCLLCGNTFVVVEGD